MIAAVLLLVPMAACDEGGLSGPEGTRTTGQVTVMLTPTNGSAAASAVLAASGPRFGRVALDRVESITVTLDSVQVRPLSADEADEDGEEEGEENGDNGEDGDGEGEEGQNGDGENGDENGDAGSASVSTQQESGDENEGEWITLGADGQELDLLDLPEDGLELAAADLPAGDYRGVRLFVSDATITFAEDVRFGNPNDPDNVFEAGTPHPLEIPSAAQTGVKVPRLDFSVPEGGAETVVLAFDGDASVRTVVATGNGRLKMSPVLVGGGPGNGGPGSGGPGNGGPGG